MGQHLAQVKQHGLAIHPLVDVSGGLEFWASVVRALGCTVWGSGLVFRRSCCTLS